MNIKLDIKVNTYLEKEITTKYTFFKRWQISQT